MSVSASPPRNLLLGLAALFARLDRASGSRRAARALSWVCVVLLAVLSLTPADEMIRTGFDHHLEHFVAYAGAAAIAAFGHGLRRGEIRVALWFALYAGLLECLQNFSPGRHPAIEDAVVSASGALCGAALIALLRRSAAPLQDRSTASL